MKSVLLEVYRNQTIQKLFNMSKPILLHIFNYCLKGKETITQPQFRVLVKYLQHQKSLFKTDFWAT